jgi:membrane-associated phospholipid phosphatase
VIRLTAARRTGGAQLRPLRLAVAVAVPAAVMTGRLRRHHRWLRPATPVAAVAAPLAFWLAAPPGRSRTAGTWALQMWAYKVLFELPYDRPPRLRRRLHMDYVLELDKALGMAIPPPQRLQQTLRSDERISKLDIGLTGLYFTWEVWPHAVLAWLLWRHPERFARASALVGATIDLTLLGYWAVPTAPPWWASQVAGRMDGSVRRVAVETRRKLRGRPRQTGHDSRGANPWASMPSDHFASSAMTALVLAECGHRAIGWMYAIALGFTLVYLGEHYLVDLVAGLALALAVKAVEPRLRPSAARIQDALGRVEEHVKGGRGRRSFAMALLGGR